MYPTVQELQIALSRLTDADHLRLRKAARIKMGGTPYRDPDELVAAAIETTISAARDQGGRRWKIGVPLMKHLFMTIRGIASDARRSNMAHPTLTGFFGPDADAALPVEDFFAPSAEDQVSALEEEQQLQQRIEAVIAAATTTFKDDPHMLWIIRGMLEGLSAREIRSLSGMSGTDYETAQRRWRRFLGRR
jgi:hypothetical protein